MTMMLDEIKQQPKVLKRCLETDKNIFNKIAKEFINKRINNIVIAARGTSDHAGIYGKYILEHCLGLPVSLAAPSIITMYNKNIDYKHSMIIGISQSGEAEDVLAVIENGNSQGALTLGITNNEKSPISKAVNYHLYTDAGIERSVAATKTFTSQMMMLAVLATVLGNDEEFFNALKEVPEEIKKILVMSEEIAKKVQRYRYMQDCFVLSRGMNYAVALESALKIQETTYVKAKGYAISDFHHGPFAMVEKDTPVIIYAPNGESSDDSIEMIEKLICAGAEVVIVSNDDEVLRKSEISFKIPYCENDMITAFYNTVFAQLFACSLSLAKGLNPDKPRGLNKVTITR